ncbi:MAG: hypothetical protein AABP62_05515 [Planctomycetota bacterium]
MPTAPFAHHNFPPLAGLCSFEEAQRTTLSVGECVGWMKRLHYVLVRLHEMLTARITAEPVYELKTAFSLHAYLCAEHASAYRQRVSELREPPLGLDVVPHEALKLLCDEVLCSPSHVELVVGIYEVIVPALIDSLEQYRATTNLLADAPSVRVNRFCLLELEDMRAFGRQATACLVDGAARERLVPWVGLLRECVASAELGARSAEQEQEDKPSALPFSCSALRAPSSALLPHFSATPFQYDPVPRRDARFCDSYNAGVNPEAFLYDDRFVARDKVLMMLYKRLREIDVPEMMASIIHQTQGKPWKFSRDMSRQLWDEARHAMLGEVGFVHLGIDWSQIPINFTWSLNLNTQLTPQERHAVLFFIEQGLMPRSGKRYEWEVGQASGLPLSALFQDFDWADEVLHSQIGREWYVKDYGDLNAALAYGDRCWSKVLSHWRTYLDQGLTEHRNWWPDVYRAACQHWGITPDPAALAFDTTYETIRADLADISASG